MRTIIILFSIIISSSVNAKGQAALNKASDLIDSCNAYVTIVLKNGAYNINTVYLAGVCEGYLRGKLVKVMEYELQRAGRKCGTIPGLDFAPLIQKMNSVYVINRKQIHGPKDNPVTLLSWTIREFLKDKRNSGCPIFFQ